uniref:Thiazole biosynthesis protein ThiS n=1 Tax=Seminavis robusta TaxID=568900 RepID=A0A3S8PZS9_9STRA|nr:thiazole biosynthesis protein ThiS [Seminavis robusta]|eukprot:Sro51_chlor_g029420.1 thiS (74) ;mRNA; f:15907-16128
MKFMSKNKNFFLNGEKYHIEDQISLLDLINYFDYNTSLLVLEYNNSICNKKNWNNISIHHNDKIEIVTIVGGG